MLIFIFEMKGVANSHSPVFGRGGIPRTAVIVALTAGLLCLALYLRALSCDFVNLDDPYFVVNNDAIRNFDGRFFSFAFNPRFDLWIPLTWISLAMDYRLWQLNPLGYHLTNILLHSLNAGLVVLIADRLFRLTDLGRSLQVRHYSRTAVLLLAGLLFALHPLRVESVAWVSERKDVLNGCFTLGAMLCYLRFAERKDDGAGGKWWYLLSLLLFALSLMAKSVSIVLPALFLVADWYPLGRLHRERMAELLREKLPFLFLSLAVATLTISLAAQHRLLLSLDDLPLGQRLLVSGHAIFEYCRLTLFPVGILPYYEIPQPIPAAFFLKTAVVVAITIGCLAGRRRHPGLLPVWLCFVIPLLPVLALLQNGDQALACRYTYLPSVAPAIAVAGGIGAIWRQTRRGKSYQFAAATGIVALLLAYGGISLRLMDVWHDTASLWTRMIVLHPLPRAFADRGVNLLLDGKAAAAAADFSAAIDQLAREGKKADRNLHAFRGVALADLGRYSEAVADFDRAIALKPHPTYFQQRGLALKALGRLAEAEADFRRAGSDPPPIDWF